jgi:hypothetical protein
MDGNTHLSSPPLSISLYEQLIIRLGAFLGSKLYHDFTNVGKSFFQEKLGLLVRELEGTSETARKKFAAPTRQYPYSSLLHQIQ